VGAGVQQIQDLFTKPPLDDEKIGGWCAMSARREISTISGQELGEVNNVFTSCTAFIR